MSLRWIGVVENFSLGIGVTPSTYPTYEKALEAAKKVEMVYTDAWRWEGPVVFCAYREDMIPSYKERKIAKAIRQFFAELRGAAYINVNTERLRSEGEEC